MKRRFRKPIGRLMPALAMLMFLSFGALMSCGGGQSKTEAEEAATADTEDFYATQPLHSGLYDASYYEITGDNEKKGHFDGRVFFSLKPENSAMYVYENGNRTKIDYFVNLSKPFEKNDSAFVSADKENNPVVLTPDSTGYTLNFTRNNNQIKISLDKNPRSTGSADEILGRMLDQKNKK